MRRKKAEEPMATAAADARISPADVQQVEFRLAFRGYNERDVDAFLDRVTEDLGSYLEDLERLRAAVGHGATAASATAADGDAIVARARDEAAAIVRRAEQEAAAIRSAAGGGTGDTRAAVAPFLNAEREFLQSLGTLVQTHAEEIKAMVLALRARASADGDGRERTGPDGAPSAEREGVGMDAPPDEPTPDADEAPVVIESATEPAFSTEGSPANRRERSLRELFWGDD